MSKAAKAALVVVNRERQRESVSSAPRVQRVRIQKARRVGLEPIPILFLFFYPNQPIRDPDYQNRVSNYSSSSSASVLPHSSPSSDSQTWPRNKGTNNPSSSSKTWRRLYSLVLAQSVLLLQAVTTYAPSDGGARSSSSRADSSPRWIGRRPSRSSV